MSDFLNILLSFLLLYKYWALFGVIFFAAIIVPFPTNSVLLAAGAFASQGYFSFFISLVVTVGANTLGDCIDYYLARRYGRKALHWLHIRLPTYVERLEAFLKKHPGPTIFVTRFVGTIEEVVSFLSGYTGVSFVTFFVADFLGNVISIGAVLYAGYLLGIHWQDFSGLFNIVGWILLGAAILAALAVALWYRNSSRTEA